MNGLPAIDKAVYDADRTACESAAVGDALYASSSIYRYGLSAGIHIINRKGL